MLKIRPAQMQVLQAERDQACIDWMAAYANRHFEKHATALQPGILQAQMSDAFHQAKNLGGQTREELALFVALWCILGPNFIRQAKYDWVTAIREDGLPEKIHRLYRCAEVEFSAS